MGKLFWWAWRTKREVKVLPCHSTWMLQNRWTKRHVLCESPYCCEETMCEVLGRHRRRFKPEFCEDPKIRGKKRAREPFRGQMEICDREESERKILRADNFVKRRNWSFVSFHVWINVCTERRCSRGWFVRVLKCTFYLHPSLESTSTLGHHRR